MNKQGSQWLLFDHGDRADIVIEGSGVQAGGDVNLLADGDVVVKEVQDTYRETTEEIHGAADLNLVVQHQAVEIAKATEGLDDAKDQVKQAEADYRQYQRDRDELETTLAELEADYEAGVPGVTHGDVVELRNLLDDVKGDEEWYIAGIATATANVVSKTTLLQQQIAGAGSSAATYGFNAGLELDIAATKTDSSMEATSSVGSTISGNNINVVTGGDGNSGNTLVQGSALDATQNLNITTGNLDVLASQDSMRSQTDTQSGNNKIAQTFAGAANGPTVNANLNSSQQQDRQTTHTNSSLTADNLNIVTTGDTTVVGGNLHGATAVDLDIGGDLTLESVQDRFSGSNKSAGVSGGVSLGGVYTNENGAAAGRGEIKTTAIGQGDGVSGANAGVNASSGRYSSSEAVVSSITGGTVNVDVDGHTQLTGSVVAAVDSEGNDTGELQLSTGSLEIANLTNRSYSSNQSIGVNASVGITESADPADPNQSGLNSSNYTYQNESSQSLDKTLATIGEGGISVGGEATDPEGLNRDIDEVNKELYAVDRQQGNVDLTVDHRLLSEDGRKQIAEDAKRTQILGTALIDIVESSVSLIGVGEGESSVREHVGNTQDYFTATKNFTQNEDNAEHVETLGNPDATPEQKQAAYTALVNEIATFMGVDPTEAKVLMENDPQFAGAHSRDTDLIYVNELAHENATEAVTTVGHETQHYLDNQENPDAEQTQQYQDNRENYAHIMGDATADYVNFNFSQNGYSLADSNSHSMGNTTDERARNAELVAGNNTDFRQEDEQALDYYLHSGQQRTFVQALDACQGESCLAETIDEYRELANQQNGFSPERQQVFDEAAESIYQQLAGNCETSACVEFTRNEMLMISTACGSETCMQERAYVVQRAQQIQQEQWGSLAVDATFDALMVGGALFPAVGAGGNNASGVPKNTGVSLQTLEGVTSEVNRNSDIAVELTRRALERGRITDSPQAFGTRAHKLFEGLNNRLDRRLGEQNSPFSIISEEFRDAAGTVTSRRARGSIGADVQIRDTPNRSFIMDLKTHGGIEVPIPPYRQQQFVDRFDAPVEEIFRKR